MNTSGINRRINRKKVDYNLLEKELNDPQSDRYIILNKLLKLIDIRKQYDAFDPKAKQEVNHIDKDIFSIIRIGKTTKIETYVNVSSKTKTLKDVNGYDLINKKDIDGLILKPYDSVWIKKKVNL